MTGVEEYRALRDTALLRERGVFVAEGRLVVRRVVDDPRYQIESVLVNDAAHRDLADALRRLPPDVPVYVRPTEDLASIAGFNVHRGCLALVKRPAPTCLDHLLSTDRALIVLEGVTDADNVGSAFRNAAALGAGGVLLSPTTCDPLYRKAVRTSMAAVLQVPFARADAWPAALTHVRAAGFTIVALTPREPSDPLDAFAASRARDQKVALVVGTEGGGLSAAVEQIADVRVRIPMSGAIDSLNVAVAIGIALYTLRLRVER